MPSYSLSFDVWLFAIALGTSAFGGMLGMASGIFIVPVLTIFGRVDIRLAIGASIVSVIACSCAGAAPALRARLTNIRLAVVLETATTLGALTGVFLGGIVPARILYLVFALILALSAQQMLMRRHETPRVPPMDHDARRLDVDGSYPDPALGVEVPYGVTRLPLGMGLMYGAGIISAMLGIGSGVLKIPAMDTALRLPIKVSTATSNFMIGVTAAASGGAYLVRGDIIPAMAGPVALGSVLGAILGAHILARFSNKALRVLFVAVLALLAVEMLSIAAGVKGLGGGG
jgi:hypothetical protein